MDDTVDAAESGAGVRETLRCRIAITESPTPPAVSSMIASIRRVRSEYGRSMLRHWMCSYSRGITFTGPNKTAFSGVILSAEITRCRPVETTLKDILFGERWP